MLKTSLRSCPICGEARGEVLHHPRFVLPEGHPLSDGYDVVACERCGFVYADTAVGQEAYDAYYAQLSKYEDKQVSSGSGEAPWDVQRLQETAQAVAQFFPDKAARLADIGCANGGLLRSLKELGFSELTGIDPSPACVANTRALGVRAEIGSLAVLPPSLGQFDGVILCHVLEHVQDLHHAVRAVADVLALNGCVYVEVPDARHYADYLVAPFQEFNTEHINHFSHPTLHYLMMLHGLTPCHEGEKVFPSTPPVLYPALYGFYRKKLRPSSGPAQGPKDTDLREKIAVYIERSQRMMQAMDARLREVLQATPRVLVWGTGQLAMKLLAETVLGSAPITAFVDGNPIHQGRTLRGIPILAPEQVKEHDEPIIITSTIYQKEIATAIRERWRLPNPIVTLAEDDKMAR